MGGSKVISREAKHIRLKHCKVLPREVTSSNASQGYCLVPVVSLSDRIRKTSKIECPAFCGVDDWSGRDTEEMIRSFYKPACTERAHSEKQIMPSHRVFLVLLDEATFDDWGGVSGGSPVAIVAISRQRSLI